METVDSGLEALITDAAAEEHRLVSSLEDTQANLDQVRSQLTAFRVTLAAYRAKQGNPPDAVDILERLAARSQSEGAVFLAEERGGIVKVTETRDMLVLAGKLASPKNSYAIVYNLLKNHDRFEPMGSATFRLKSNNGIHDP